MPTKPKPDAVQTGIPFVLKNASKKKWCIQSAKVSVRDLNKEDEEELVRVLTTTDNVREQLCILSKALEVLPIGELKD